MVDRAVVLAVGSSTHQSQLIYSRPRAMLPVLGKPLVARAMERLYRAGIKKFTVIVGDDEGAVGAYLNAHWLSNISLEFIIQPPHVTLTQSVCEIVKRDDQPFVLAAYNSLTHANFPDHLLKAYTDSQDELVLCGAPMSLSRSNSTDYGLIEGQLVKSISKSKPKSSKSWLLHISLARCGANFVSYLREKTTNPRNQVMDIFRDYLETGAPVIPAETAWVLPVETDFDLLTVNKNLLDDGQDAYILSELGRNVEVIPPVRIDSKVSIAVGAKIGPHVYLESGCSVGPNAVLKNAVVLQNAIVPAGSNLSDVVVSSRVTIRV